MMVIVYLGIAIILWCKDKKNADESTDNEVRLGHCSKDLVICSISIHSDDSSLSLN